MKKFTTYFLISLSLFLSSFISLNAKDFKGAEYRTIAAYTYGRFEVRMKSAAREGMLSSFFTYHEITSTAQWNEIDIEIMGRYDDDVQYNTITPGQTNHVHHQHTPFDPSSDFHDYAFEWTPTYVAWFIDGVEVNRQTGSHISTLNQPQKIMMNIWNPSYANWAGVWNTNILPAFAYYDRVTYYSYTPGTGTYGTGNNFTLLWNDDFNSFDSNRWQKATHTFDGNGCDFVPENVVFKDGVMILCLTKAANLGYTDVEAPTALYARAIEDNIVEVKFSEELDSTSVTSLDNYITNGGTITAAKISANKRSVILNVTGLPATPTNLIIRNVKDASSNHNVMVMRALTIFRNKLVFPAKINVGGSATNGYLADVEFKDTTDYGFLDGSTSLYDASIVIGNTTEPFVYRSERYGLGEYKIRVPNGKYNVKLMFKEGYFTTQGARVFDVYVNNTLAVNNLDIYKLVGKNNAYELTLNNIEVSTNMITVHFGAETDMALINGIVIDKVATSINEKNKEEQTGFFLENNYPNPFSSETNIRFNVYTPGNYSYAVYSVTGEKILSEQIGYIEKGVHNIQLHSRKFNSTTPANGIYFFELRGTDKSQFKKILLMN